MRGPCRRSTGDKKGRLRVVAAEKPLSQGHEAVMEKSWELSSVELRVQFCTGGCEEKS
jgi:hypothetical protein